MLGVYLRRPRDLRVLPWYRGEHGLYMLGCQGVGVSKAVASHHQVSFGSGVRSSWTDEGESRQTIPTQVDAYSWEWGAQQL